MVLKYETFKPYPGIITGFHDGSMMLVRKLLDGSDLGFGSKWAISKIKNNKVNFHALNAPSIWSTRTYNLTNIRTHFDPLR